MAMSRLVHCAVGLVTVAAAALGCSVAVDSSEATRQSAQNPAAEPTAVASESTTPSWACSPSRREEFFTDPIIHDRDVPLRRIASQVADHASFEIQRAGLMATVTFLDRRGLILRRFEYIRGHTRGWSLEGGERCPPPNG